MVVVQFLLQGKDTSWFIKILLYIFNLLFSYIWIRSTMDLVDKNTFSPFSIKTIPSYKQFWDFFKTSILSSIFILIGFILLIVPGIYISGRLLFATYLSVEKSQGSIKNISESWNMTKGYGWKLFWKSFLIGLFALVGFIALFIGSLVTYPIAMIVLVMLYRDFLKAKSVELATVKEEIKTASDSIDKVSDSISFETEKTKEITKEEFAVSENENKVSEENK